MKKIRCMKCEHLVERDERTLSSCLCDPDAPTWVALKSDGSVMSFSHSRYEVIE